VERKALPFGLDRIAVVLVRPESPGNVGAVARIVRNFGFGPLRVVAAAGITEEAEARRLAHRSLDVLSRAEHYPDLPGALAERRWVVGTSGRLGRTRAEPAAARSVAARLAWQAETHPGAIVFGPESEGLSLGDLAWCDEVIRIPQRMPGPSLNLAQAAAVVCSEIFQAALVPGSRPPMDMAGWEDVNRVARRMARAARHCGMAVRNRPEELPEVVRRVLTNHAYTPHELAVLERWLAQIEWFVGLEHRPPCGDAPQGGDR